MSVRSGRMGAVLRIATVNVNGIRAAFRRGMGEWLARSAPDVLLLQEVRADDEILADHLSRSQWDLAHEAAVAKGRAGVAVASRLPMRAIRIGLRTGAATDSGRWVEADLDLPGGGVLTVVSAYVHSGTAGTPSMDEKYAFLEAATARLRVLGGGAEGGGGVDAAGGAAPLAVVAGDLNIAHREADLKNWKGNLKSAGFLPEERAYLDRWFGEVGWHDVGRELAGPGPGPYTWWSWRGKAFDQDAGWRIDYQVATPALAATARSWSIDRAATYEARFSDHAPFVVDYAV